jgi:hypothetical protein
MPSRTDTIIAKNVKTKGGKKKLPAIAIAVGKPGAKAPKPSIMRGGY